MTIDILKSFGANVEEGLARCLNDEEFYLQMVEMGLGDERFETLGPLLKEGKIEEAFEASHALKGILSNLVLTPILVPLSELTELLRAKKEGDYLALFNEMKSKRDQLLSMQG